MTPAPQKAWLFTTHSPDEIFSSYASLDAESDLLIAVDGGLARLHALGLPPSLIIGDLDSVDPALLELYPDVPRVTYPSRKNETDTELAALWCLEQGEREIVICNDLEGRFDHALALLQNLKLLQSKGVDARIESRDQLVFFLAEETVLTGREGCLLSLFAWAGPAVFASSEGLLYPLRGLVLEPSLSRGVSNRVEASPASLGLSSGRVLAVLTK